MHSKKIKPVVHITKSDSLKMIKIRTTRPIKTRTIEVGANGKEYVVKDWA